MACLFREINRVRAARIDVGRGPLDAARVEGAADRCRGPAAGRSLLKVSRRRVSADRPKRVRHCCRSAATEGGRLGAVGREVRREEKTAILGRRAHARARPHDARRLRRRRVTDVHFFSNFPPLFRPRRVASHRVRTGAHTGRCGSQRQRGDAAD